MYGRKQKNNVWRVAKKLCMKRSRKLCLKGSIKLGSRKMMYEKIIYKVGRESEKCNLREPAEKVFTKIFGGKKKISYVWKKSCQRNRKP